MSRENTPEITTVAERLIDAGTAFIAVPNNALADGRVDLLYHLPTLPSEDLSAYLAGLNHVVVGDETYPLTCTNVLHSEVHFARRLAVYAAQNPVLGLQDKPLDKGAEQLRKWLTSSRNPVPPTPETAPLNAPLQKLIIGGAVAIGLEKELLRLADDKLLFFTVYGPPAIGARLVDQYEEVVFNEETYDVDWHFTIHGPAFNAKVPVYASDNILGLDPVPFDTGWENLETYIREIGEKRTGKS